MPNVDLLIVNPPGRTQVYQTLASTLAGVENPVWAGLLAAFARVRGYDVAILDAAAEGLTTEQAAATAAEWAPRLTVVVVYGHQPSASTQNMPAAGALVAAIKDRNPSQPVLLVGGHVAALPERTLLEERADFVCAGEGFHTITELVDALRGGSGVDRVRDLVWRDRAETRRNQAAPLVMDLDHEVPGIPWELLPMDKYRAHNWHCLETLVRMPYAALYTTLGCPFKCTFCCIQAPFRSGEQALGMRKSENSYRFWSPDRVVGEIDVLAGRYGVRNLKIADELFVFHRGHVEAICERLIERRYGLNMWAYARVDTVRPELLDKLKRAGVNWLAIGIEAADERVRAGVGKGLRHADITQTIGRVRDAGINVIGNYLFGLPLDDHDTMQATLQLALDLNCEFANFYCTMAYPGSPLYRTAVEQGWELPATWGGYAQHAVEALPLRTKYLTSAEVLRFRDHAFHTYFTTARYLDMLRQKFGPAAVTHIQEMTAHKLERRFA